MAATTLRQKIAELPPTAGVYLFRGKNNEILYVGKSRNVRERARSHFAAKGEKSRLLVARAKNIKCIPVSHELEALLLEAELIKKHLPWFNSRAKDDKHPLYIKITAGEEFPKVNTCRLEAEPGAVYFGPFPSSSTTRQVLRDLRKIFPYCGQKRPGKKPCFYSHLGLCNPCPATIAGIRDANLKEKLKQEYRQNIRRLVLVLSGKVKTLIGRLVKDMKKAANEKNFETAAKVRDELRGLQYITADYRPTGVYLQNPNFLEDLRRLELSALKKILRGFLPGLRTLTRIEYLDIAHISGEAATASLVVFLNGEPEKNLYRRFRIRTAKTQDDFSMMQEVARRRTKHFEDWGKPDLLVVDGGKPQVSAAKSVLINISLPVIGFAKRFEEIVIHDNRRFHIVRLKTGDPALNLLRRLENEAHRFARGYHFKLRLRKVLGT
ncbi:MAG: GIY-YIG nuclease family protein [Candidatus Blackburnbacteria bacterium]|nr:GIY-YIG nuclease family protein [Candidatus Blackburnbacteria bacterium]